MVHVAEQVGGGHHRPGRDLAREVLRRKVRHLHIAALQRNKLGALPEQGGVQVQLDVEVGGEVALEAAHGLPADVLVGEDGGEAQALAGLGLRRDGGGGGECGGRGHQGGPASDQRLHGRFPVPKRSLVLLAAWRRPV